jgi:hypothetical protein
MNEKPLAGGTITAVLRRLETQVLPRILEMKERLDHGEKLSLADIRYLQMGLSDATYAKMLFDHHPEFTGISAKVVALYRDISTLALRNEGTPHP